MTDAERAVLEAAQAWYYYRLGSPYEQQYARLRTLEQAIEALLVEDLEEETNGTTIDRI